MKKIQQSNILIKKIIMNELRLANIEGKISTVQDVLIRSLSPDNPSTLKGKNTWNWVFPEKTENARVMIACRHKDTTAGNHFHTRILGKDPERFLFIDGKMNFWFKDLFGGYIEKVIDTTELGVVDIQIPSYILHGLTVLSDKIWFIEQQAEAFNPSINYSVAEFEKLARSLKKDIP